MVKLYHTTHYFQAEEAFTLGRLESGPEKRLRELADRLGSHAKAEDLVKTFFGKNRYSHLGKWFKENYLICQTQLRPEAGGWINSKLTKNHVVVLELELDGHLAAQEFDFHNSQGIFIRTVLGKDRCEPNMEYAIHPDYVGIQSADLEHLVSLIVSPGILSDTKIALTSSEHDFLKKVPVNILYNKDRQWYAFEGI